MIAFPNAKINLGLDIVGKRSDGFHNISSCFYPIPLRDVLEINESKNFSLELSGLPIQGELDSNLVSRAYRLLKKDFDLPQVSIHLHKNIPLEAGLGGGSADGSFTLRMLDEYFDLFLGDDLLEDYAARLGSDCPFFIHNKPALISGRGEQMDQINLDLSGYSVLIVKPLISISTSEAYKRIKPKVPAHDIRSILTESDIVSWKGMLKNDFEKVLMDMHPEISIIKSKIYAMGALYASLTGSGSAIFGIFSEPPGAADLFPANYFKWTGTL